MVVVDMVVAQIDRVAAEAVNCNIVEADNSVDEVEVDYCAAEAGLIVAEHCCFALVEMVFAKDYCLVGVGMVLCS